MNAVRNRNSCLVGVSAILLLVQATTIAQSGFPYVGGSATVTRSNGVVLRGNLVSLTPTRCQLRLGIAVLKFESGEVKEVQAAGDTFTWNPQKRRFESQKALTEHRRQRDLAASAQVANQTSETVTVAVDYYVDLDGNRQTPSATWLFESGVSSRLDVAGSPLAATELGLLIRTSHGQERSVWHAQKPGEPITVTVGHQHVDSYYTGEVSVANNTNQQLVITLLEWVDGFGTEHASRFSSPCRPQGIWHPKAASQPLTAHRVSFAVKNSFGEETLTWTKDSDGGTLSCSIGPTDLTEPPTGAYRPCANCGGKGEIRQQCTVCKGAKKKPCDGEIPLFRISCIRGYYHNVPQLNGDVPGGVEAYLNIPCKRCRATGFIECDNCSGTGVESRSCPVCRGEGKYHVFAP